MDGVVSAVSYVAREYVRLHVTIIIFLSGGVGKCMLQPTECLLELQSDAHIMQVERVMREPAGVEWCLVLLLAAVSGITRVMMV